MPAPKKLTQTKRDEMFAAWVERPSIRHVAQKCGISTTTVRRYIEWDKWTERFDNIQAKARKKADTSIAKAIADNLVLVRYAKAQVTAAIQNRKDAASKFPINDLDKLVRLENLLMGEADSRPELANSELAGFTTEQLLELRKRLENNG